MRSLAWQHREDVNAAVENARSKGMALAAATALSLLATGIPIGSTASGTPPSPLLSDLQQRSRLGSRLLQDHTVSLRPTHVVSATPVPVATSAPVVAPAPQGAVAAQARSEAPAAQRIEGVLTPCAENPGTCTVSGMARELANRLARQEHVRIFPRRTDFFRALQTGVHNGVPTDLWGLNRVGVGDRIALVRDANGVSRVEVESRAVLPASVQVPSRVLHSKPRLAQDSPSPSPVSTPAPTASPLVSPRSHQVSPEPPPLPEETPPPPEPVIVLPLKTLAPTVTPILPTPSPSIARSSEKLRRDQP